MPKGIYQRTSKAKNAGRKENHFLFRMITNYIYFCLTYCRIQIRVYICAIKFKKSKMKAIINRTEIFGTLNGVITKNEEIRKVVNQHLKQGTAKLLIDSEETLMYELGEQKPNSNMHPIFAQSLQPFGIK